MTKKKITKTEPNRLECKIWLDLDDLELRMRKLSDQVCSLCMDLNSSDGVDNRVYTRAAELNRKMKHILERIEDANEFLLNKMGSRTS